MRMGLVPESGTCLLPKIIGYSQAKLMCLTADAYNAEKALKIGLIDEVVKSGSLLDTAKSMAEKLAKAPSNHKPYKSGDQ